MEKIAYFYLKSTYFSPKTDIRFTKNGGTFSKKGIYVFILKNIASYLALY